MLRSLGLLALLVAASAPSVAAQHLPPDSASARGDSVRVLDLPDDVAQAVIDFLNDPRRVHFTGATRIEADSTVRSDIAVLDGTLVLGGRVEGSVLMVNGNAEVLTGATITGDLLVVGGEAKGVEGATIGGEVLTYPGRLRYRQEGGRIIHVRPAVPSRTDRDEERRDDWGHSDLLIATGKSYNRVEGLPITFGPRIETAGSNPLRVHALAIYRSVSGFSLDTREMGYYVRAEQLLGGRRTMRIGVTAHSLVDPIEEWQLSDLENALATFVFHRDFRDYYQRRGISAFAGWSPRESVLEVQAEARWEHHDSQGPGSPWTLFDNAEPWRPQPLIAEGDLASVALQASLDSRSGAPDPATGWLLQGRIEQGFDVDLYRPEAFARRSDPGEPETILVGPQSFGRFTTGMLDLRRYNRVDPRARLNFRFIAAGSLDGSPLPPQRQHSLGGEGSLPGYGLFEFDCGARSELVYLTLEASRSASGPAFFPQYGCDGFAMLQAEFRGKLSFRLRWDDAPWQDDDEDGGRGWDVGWNVSPDWSVFVDAGQGWAMDSRLDEDLAVDVGVGLLVDRMGIYLAKPLAGGRGMNIFLRLGPRF